MVGCYGSIPSPIMFLVRTNWTTSYQQHSVTSFLHSVLFTVLCRAAFCCLCSLFMCQCLYILYRVRMEIILIRYDIIYCCCSTKKIWLWMNLFVNTKTKHSNRTKINTKWRSDTKEGNASSNRCPVVIFTLCTFVVFVIPVLADSGTGDGLGHW